MSIRVINDKKNQLSRFQSRCEPDFIHKRLQRGLESKCHALGNDFFFGYPCEWWHDSATLQGLDRLRALQMAAMGPSGCEAALKCLAPSDARRIE
jgi:hypothetical protein